MNNFEYQDMDIVEDDLDALEIIDVGVLRRIIIWEDHFDSLDDIYFFKRFRLTKATTLEVLNLIEHRLEIPFDRNYSVSPITQLLITLRFYATGSHLMAIGDFTGVHESTASRIVKRVSEAIAQLAPRKIKFPTAEEIQTQQQSFFNIAVFPRVLGALDGTHIRIQRPSTADSEIYRNRKQYFSINVEAICDTSMKFTNIVARWPGSTHDATVFNNSNIREEFEIGNHPNCILLGDSAYPCRSYLMPPLLNPITRPEQLYNQSQIRTRGRIEKSFGIWKRRFPVLAYGFRLKLETVITLIIATAVLHNISRDMGENEPPEDELDDQRINLNQLIIEGFITPERVIQDDRNQDMFEARANLL